jgi:hypothetical protein
MTLLSLQVFIVDYTVNIRFHNYLVLLLVAEKPVNSAAVLRDLYNSSWSFGTKQHMAVPQSTPYANI